MKKLERVLDAVIYFTLSVIAILQVYILSFENAFGTVTLLAIFYVSNSAYSHYRSKVDAMDKLVDKFITLADRELKKYKGQIVKE